MGEMAEVGGKWRQKTEIQREEAARDGEDRAETPGEWASAVMALADRFSSDGELSCSELTAYLSGTRYAAFGAWLVEGMKNFGKFDTDRSGSMNIRELEKAISEYRMDQEIIEITKQSMTSQSQAGGGSRGTPAGMGSKRAATAKPRGTASHARGMSTEKAVRPLSHDAFQDLLSSAEQRKPIP